MSSSSSATSTTGRSPSVLLTAQPPLGIQMDRNRGRGAERQLDPERGSTSLFALESDGPAVCLHDGAGNGKAETNSGNRPLGGGRGPEEALEQAVLLGGRDPDAGVAHLEQRLVAAAGQIDVDRS